MCVYIKLQCTVDVILYLTHYIVVIFFIFLQVAIALNSYHLYMYIAANMTLINQTMQGSDNFSY